MNREESLAAIRSVVADSLAVELDEVANDSSLVNDLGADSLDFIDIMFQLEKEFGVKIREEELNLLSRIDISSPEVFQNGYLTKEAIEKLLPWLPSLQRIERSDKVTPADLLSMITVETLWIIVDKKLAERSKQATVRLRNEHAMADDVARRLITAGRFISHLGPIVTYHEPTCRPLAFGGSELKSFLTFRVQTEIPLHDSTSPIRP